MVGFHAQKQAWYIECVSCVEELAVNEPWAQLIHDTTEDYETQYKEYISGLNVAEGPSTPPVNTGTSEDQDSTVTTTLDTVGTSIVATNGVHTGLGSASSLHSVSSTTKLLAKPGEEQRKGMENGASKYIGVQGEADRSQTTPVIKKQKIEVVDLSLE